MEFALGQIEPDRLAAIPGQPGQQEIGDQQRPAGVQADTLVETLDLAGIDFLPVLIQIDFADFRRSELVNVNQVLVFHAAVPLSGAGEGVATGLPREAGG